MCDTLPVLGDGILILLMVMPHLPTMQDQERRLWAGRRRRPFFPIVGDAVILALGSELFRTQEYLTTSQ